MQVGTAIGPYVVRRHLGDGGMGSVWLAEDTRLHRLVALKTLHAARGSDAIARERLMREARAAAALNHPHIATVHDVLDLDGEVTIVFEYVDGVTLAVALQDGRWPFNRVAACGIQLAKALAAAHAQGIVHRDLKPSNVIVGRDGDIKVLDFGIARLLSHGTTVTATGETLTASGFVGTPAYAAPEQMLSAAVDERADLYALGVILFELATGRRPFEGRDALSLASAKLGGEAPRVSSTDALIPPAFDSLVSRLLARDPFSRPATANEVATALRAITGESSTQVLPRHSNWRRWSVAAALLTAAITAAVISIGRPRPAPPHAGTPVVAVLPLRNSSGDPSKDFLAAGLSESLMTSLASSASLVVLSRTAIADAMKTDTSIKRAVDVLGASFVIDGSVQQSGEKLRVALNLVRADQSVAWGRTFDGTLGDVFDLQTRMALELGEALPVAESGRRPGMAPAHPRALEAYWKGRAFLDRWDLRGNVDAAISSLQEAVALDPNFALAHAGLVLAYWQKYSDTRDEQYARLSIEEGGKAAALDPNLPEVRYALAVSLAGTGRQDDAITQLRQALTLRPTFDEARRKLGEVLAATGQLTEAITEFDRAIALRPRFWGGYSDKGVALIRAARHEEAAAAFEQAVALQPDNNVAFQQLGAAYQFMGQRAKAIAAYEKAQAIRPSFGTYSNLGVLHHISGDYASAVAAYQQAIALQPKIATLYRNLGDSYRRMGRREDAMRAYAQAIERAEADLTVNPNSARTMASLAVYLVKAGRTAEGLAGIAKALKLAPKDVQVRFRAAAVNALAGRTDEALNHIEAAVQLGYSVRAVQEEEDFVTLRSTPRFNAITKQTQER